jgi:hypothetical protein
VVVDVGVFQNEADLFALAHRDLESPKVRESLLTVTGLRLT